MNAMKKSNPEELREHMPLLREIARFDKLCRDLKCPTPRRGYAQLHAELVSAPCEIRVNPELRPSDCRAAATPSERRPSRAADRP
jgi:hypothetical protein